MDEQHSDGDASADELLRRALLDEAHSAAVAMRVDGLALCDELTLIFHGRRDLSTIQTYVALGAHGTGAAIAGDALLRVPCDLDLADAIDRDEARRLYRDQAGRLRDAVIAADTVLAVWIEPLAELTRRPVAVERGVASMLDAPAPRLIPVALRAPERQLRVVAVCSARTLAEGRPPLGIACIQQERQPRLPADRRPRARPRRLPRPGRRARPPARRPARPPGGLGRALPGALRGLNHCCSRGCMHPRAVRCMHRSPVPRPA